MTILSDIIDGRSSRVIQVDQWDREDWQTTLDRVPSVPVIIEELEEFTSCAPDLVADEGAILLKADPQIRPAAEVRDDRRRNRAVMQALIDDPGYEALHDLCMGDPISTGLSVVCWRNKTEEILARTEHQQEELEQLQQERDKLAQMHEDDPDIQEQQALVDGLEESTTAQLEAAELSLAAFAREMVKQATDERTDEQTLARAAGTEPGEFKRMSPEERFKLAKLLNTKHFQDIAKWFGLMRNLLSPHERRELGVPQELVGVTWGSDLALILPDQLALMDDPDLELLFLKDLASGSLPIYEYEGTVESGAGGVVCCIDSSYSMNGEMDCAAKAVALNLLNIAKVQHRPFRVIHFDTATSEQTFKDFSLDEAIDMATIFLGGGTNYRPPLTKALDFLRKEAKAGDVQSDIVFITDGEPSDMHPKVPETVAWIDKFLQELEDLGGTVWGVALGFGATSWSLDQICQGKVIPITHLASQTKTFKKVFDGVGRARKPRRKI